MRLKLKFIRSLISMIFSKKEKSVKKKSNFARKTALTGGAIAIAASSGFVFGERSKTNLDTVCPAPQQLAYCAIQETEIDFMVIEGFRPQERQNELYAQGRTKAGKKVTWTLNSRHTSGRAFDIVALKNGEIDWSPTPYKNINEAFKTCSIKLDIPYVWGGTFSGRDWGHFETISCTVEKQKVDI